MSYKSSVTTTATFGVKSFLAIASGLIICLPVVGCAREGYQKVEGRWAFVDYNSSGERVRIELAENPDTVTVISDSRYAVSESGFVYLEGEVLPKAKSESFQVLSSGYSRDDTSVYCGTIPIVGANPLEFEVLYDSDPVFRLGKGNGEALRGKYFGENFDCGGKRCIVAPGWSRDNNNVYFGPEVVEGADPDSFRLLDEYYGRDDENLFFRIWRIDNVDLSTFRVSKFSAAEDSKGKFLLGERRTEQD